jgi:hypothetical protein
LLASSLIVMVGNNKMTVPETRRLVGKPLKYSTYEMHLHMYNLNITSFIKEIIVRSFCVFLGFFLHSRWQWRHTFGCAQTTIGTPLRKSAAMRFFTALHSYVEVPWVSERLASSLFTLCRLTHSDNVV